MSGPLEVLREVAERLEKAGIDYFLVGSLASMYYGRPRFTNDLDLVIKIKPSQVMGFENLFPIEEYYCPPVETISDEVIRGGTFNLIHHATGVKVDLMILKPTEFYESEFSRRKKVGLLPNLSIYIASPEDVILKKLDFFREGGSEKHLVDIRTMLTETLIDRAYLLHWVSKLGLQEEWRKVE